MNLAKITGFRVFSFLLVEFVYKSIPGALLSRLR